MSKNKKYNLNSETLLYEIAKTPRKKRLMKFGSWLLVSIGMTFVYFYLYVSVLGNDPPKTAILKKNNAQWRASIELMNRTFDVYEEALDNLNMRNDDIYRSIFGMNSIPQEVLNAGFGGTNRYAYLDQLSHDSPLKDTYIRLDKITKQTYVQSKSFDEVSNLSKRAGDMASCIPAISPINPIPGSYRISSSFGTRRDPIHGNYRHHDGVDFATKTGNPIYATGDGVIESVTFQFFGYGNYVIIDHGFGYKTRYAHMSTISVVEGMEVKRGDCIGAVGNTGKSTGPHLHYEVVYRGSKVNPYNFYDLSIHGSEYEEMVSNREEESDASLRPQFRLQTR